MMFEYSVNETKNATKPVQVSRIDGVFKIIIDAKLTKWCNKELSPHVLIKITNEHERSITVDNNQQKSNKKDFHPHCYNTFTIKMNKYVNRSGGGANNNKEVKNNEKDNNYDDYIEDKRKENDQVGGDDNETYELLSTVVPYNFLRNINSKIEKISVHCVGYSDEYCE